MYNPQRKHKANHCGYKQRPTKGAINGLLSMYDDINKIVIKATEQFIPTGTQLKLNL